MDSAKIKPKLKLHPCQECGELIPKKSYESRNRYKNRKYCSTTCAKTYMRKHKIGWFNPGIQTIGKKKKRAEGDKLPPFLWTDRELREWNEDYPELRNF